ncbi:hypothetical protein Xen7305DRAFT_00024310 [Xenococcus sp. PCC 7305]|uniref:hypothetical protein n=1 Tax=Xenococcus sp. PCC 7305 TaxID=102125 RepID=UPI0002AC282A|nr:hypothetical protein [Xenococcus sp. PCC 7305]ELS02713.1 hypothetical protein Xen7305DRAFT_00024310 [Xenococcus sp. PCC 7305]
MTPKALAEIIDDMSLWSEDWSQLLSPKPPKGTVSRWLSKESVIPRHYIKQIIKLNTLFQKELQKFLAEIPLIGIEKLYYVRYYDNQEFWEFSPSLHNCFLGCADFYNGFLNAITKKLQQQNISVFTVDFKRGKYVSWLKSNKFTHNQARLNEWAKFSYQPPMRLDKLPEDMRARAEEITAQHSTSATDHHFDIEDMEETVLERLKAIILRAKLKHLAEKRELAETP